MSWSRLACLVPLFTAACFDDLDIAHSLAQADGLHVQVDVMSSGGGATVEVKLFSREACIALDDSFVVRANGWASDRSRDFVHPGDDSDICYEPTVRMTVPDEYRTAGDIEVLDRTRRVALPIGGLLERRTARLVTPADGVLRAGGRVDIEWSHPEDLTREAGFVARIGIDPRKSFPLTPNPEVLTGTAPSPWLDEDTQLVVSQPGRSYPEYHDVAPGEQWRVTAEIQTMLPVHTVP